MPALGIVHQFVLAFEPHAIKVEGLVELQYINFMYVPATGDVCLMMNCSFDQGMEIPRQFYRKWTKKQYVRKVKMTLLQLYTSEKALEVTNIRQTGLREKLKSRKYQTTHRE